MTMVNLGFFHLPINYFLILIAFISSLICAYFIKRKYKIQLNDYLWNALFTALISARVLFIISYWKDYLNPWWSFIDIRDGGFSFIGFILGLIIYLLYFIKKRPKNIKPMITCLLVAIIVWLLSFAFNQFYINANSQNHVFSQQNFLTLKDENFNFYESISEHSSQIAVVNYWASWCPPCRAEMPMFLEAQKEFKDTLFIFANQGEQKQVVNDFIDKLALTEMKNIILDQQQILAHEAEVKAFPTTLVFNKKGKLIAWHSGMLSKASLKKLIVKAKEKVK